jgi:glycosyltransferase involved in cell wall biosynthesis
MLLKAYQELMLYKEDISLVIIGKKDLSYTTFENHYQSLPESVKRMVLRLENVAHHELLSFYYYADLFIYPSKAEGFGIPPLEAAAMKVNTLCSYTTAMSEFNFFENHLFDPMNIEELKKKITFALVNREDTNRRTNIANIIADRYDWKKIANSFSQKIQSLFYNHS